MSIDISPVYFIKNKKIQAKLQSLPNQKTNEPVKKIGYAFM